MTSRASLAPVAAALCLLLAAACADDPPAPEAPGEPEETEPDPEDEPEDPEPEPEDEPEPEPEAAPDLGVPLTLTEVASMRAPTAAAVGPDGTLYLAERAGTVHPLAADGLGDAVLDLSGDTTTDGERGLLGLAFAADGSELFVSYTDRAGDSVIAAYAVEDGEVVGDDRRVLLTQSQPYANHNGGDLAVGPDGMLYISLGDGGSAGDPLGSGQDRSTLLGALLRIDPAGGDPYAVPADNPFVGDGSGADEIWAYGLRNPWRFSFDRDTDDLWIADVGQNAREEINWVAAADGTGGGANFGWNLMEGTLPFAGSEPDDHVPPVHEYDTTPQRCAITGGYVYRGDAIPELRGAYLFSDFCEAALRAIVIDDDGEVTDEAELSVSGASVTSFAQDADGELYLLDFGGVVWRIDPASGD